MCFRVFLWTYTYRCLTDQWLGGTHRVRVTGFENFCCKCLVLVGQCVYACSFMTHGWVSIIDNHWPQTSPSKKVVHILGWMLDANENLSRAIHKSSTLIGAIWLPILLCRRLPHLYSMQDSYLQAIGFHKWENIVQFYIFWWCFWSTSGAVSYTQMTLPTNR